MNIARANIYTFFSVLFLEEPSNETIKIFPDILNALSDIIKNTISSITYEIEEIKEDYNGLFVSVGSKYLKPYESVYTDNGLVNSKTTNAVKKFYTDAKVNIKDYDDLPDHIGLELNFMAYLCKQDMVKEQKEFLENHLCKWINEFCDNLMKKSSTDFYKVIGKLLNSYIEYDLKYFKTS